MGLKSQAKNPLVGLIIEKATKRGVETNCELSKLTKVSTSAISRFFRGHDIHIDSLYNILNYCDLIRTPGSEKREISKLYKELAEERKISREATHELSNLKSHLLNRIRKGDLPGLNTVKLRKIKG